MLGLGTAGMTSCPFAWLLSKILAIVLLAARSGRRDSPRHRKRWRRPKAFGIIQARRRQQVGPLSPKTAGARGEIEANVDPSLPEESAFTSTSIYFLEASRVLVTRGIAY